MTLRSDAIAAYQSTQTGRATKARAALAAALTPEDVSKLTVADVDTAAQYTRYVFTDGDVNLAVVLRQSGNEVHLVSGKPGSWSDLAPIDSLATLGKVLPGLVPPPAPPSGPAAWSPDTVYKAGDVRTYAGKTYTCLQGHTSMIGWEPPNVAALWKVTA